MQFENEARERLARLEARLGQLESFVHVRNSLMCRSLQAAGFFGDYVEFGVYVGHSFAHAYNCAKLIETDFTSGHWDRSFTSVEERKRFVDFILQSRFIGFDSFEGLPKIEGVDSEIPIFKEGTYASTEDSARRHLLEHNVDMNRVKLVKGYFEQTLNEKKAQEIGLKKIRVAHIDSDLYSSACLALDFCTPYFRNGSVVVFDEWFQYSGSPDHGEQRAFREWLQKNPQWHAAELGREFAGRLAFILTNPKVPG